MSIYNSEISRLEGCGCFRLLASGLTPARPDVCGIDHIFTFFALPGRQTCFQNMEALPAGHALCVQQNSPSAPSRVEESTWWEVDFPDCPEPISASPRVVDEFEALLVQAVERRLRADVPVAAHLSGGVDSTLVASIARRRGNRRLTTFTLQIQAAGLDESGPASASARYVNGESVMIPCSATDILAAYPRLVRAAEVPVSDTCCAALLLLAQEVHKRGFRVALTGEGADELLAGYPWSKLERLRRTLDGASGLPLSGWGRRFFLRWVGGSDFSWSDMARNTQMLGVHPG